MQNYIIYNCFTLHTKMGKKIMIMHQCSVSIDVEVEAQNQLANYNIYT